MPDPFQAFQSTGARILQTQTSFQPIFSNCQVNINMNIGQYWGTYQGDRIVVELILTVVKEPKAV